MIGPWLAICTDHGLNPRGSVHGNCIQIEIRIEKM